MGVEGDTRWLRQGRQCPHAHHSRIRTARPTGPDDLAWSRPGEELWCVSE